MSILSLLYPKNGRETNKNSSRAEAIRDREFWDNAKEWHERRQHGASSCKPLLEEIQNRSAQVEVLLHIAPEQLPKAGIIESFSCMYNCYTRHQYQVGLPYCGC